MTKQLDSTASFASQLTQAYAIDNVKHEYIGRKCSGRAWKLEKNKTRISLSAEKILDLLGKEVRASRFKPVDKIESIRLKRAVESFTKNLKRKESKLIGWNRGRQFFVKLLNCIRGRGWVTTSGRAEKLLTTIEESTTTKSRRRSGAVVRRDGAVRPPTDLLDQEVEEFVKNNPNVERLDLKYCYRITDVGLAKFACYKDRLLELRLSGVKQKITDVGLSAFKGCTKLQKLDLGFLPVTDEGLANFKECIELRELSLSRLKQVTDKGLTSFEKCVGLQNVWLSHLPQVTSFLPLLHRDLQKLRLSELPEVTDLSSLERCKKLQGLTVWDLPKVTDLSVLAGCSGLHTIRLSHLSKVTDLSVLNKCDSLQ